VGRKIFEGEDRKIDEISFSALMSLVGSSAKVRM